MTATLELQTVTAEEARSEMTRILSSPDFAASRQLSSFLQYIVGESLAGRADHLKERTVASGALARGSDFDPRLDCVVRVVAGKLRRSLQRYYTQQGATDALCIDVPKGTYCPVFRRRETSRPRAIAEAAARPVVAVVPIKSLTPGVKERFLADLLADDIVVRLGRLRGLEVIDCLAAESARNYTKDLCKTALGLHANFVFGGTIGRVRGRVRLTVRLIDGHSRVLVWGDQFDLRIDNGSLVQQDDIADRIAKNIGGYLGLVR